MDEAEKLFLKGLKGSIDGVAKKQDDINTTLTKHTGLLSEVKTKVEYQNGEVKQCKKDRKELYEITGVHEIDLTKIRTIHNEEEKHTETAAKLKQNYQTRDDVKITKTRLILLCVFGGISLIASIVFGILSLM